MAIVSRSSEVPRAVIPAEIVPEESVRQLVDKRPEELPSEALALIAEDTVHSVNKTLAERAPYIIELKKRFDKGIRDELGYLKTPIADCYSWSEFCTSKLRRSRQAVHKSLKPYQPLKPKQAKKEKPHEEAATVNLNF